MRGKIPTIQKGITLLELLIGIVIAALIFLVVSGFVTSLFGISNKQKRLEALEQTKNDIQADLTVSLKWATESISFTDGKLSTDGTIYELINGILYKNGQPLTSEDITINSFSIYKHSSSVVPTDLNAGFGLQGDYFNTINFTEPVLSRIDPQINYNWGTNSPDLGMDSDTFSVRWSGQLETGNRSGMYEFETLSNDGVKLYVDDQLVIDGWSTGTRSRSGQIFLDAQKRYNFLLEYFEESGDANIELKWTEPGQGSELMPSTRLYPTPLSASLEVIIELSHSASPDIQSILKLIISPRRGGVVGAIDQPPVTPIPTSVTTPGPSPLESPTPTVIDVSPTLTNRPTTTPGPSPTRRPTNTPSPTSQPLP